MYKAPLIVAFCLSVLTYAVLYHYQGSAPPDKPTMIVVFGIWFGLAALVGWFRGRKGGP